MVLRVEEFLLLGHATFIRSLFWESLSIFISWITRTVRLEPAALESQEALAVEMSCGFRADARLFPPQWTFESQSLARTNSAWNSSYFSMRKHLHLIFTSLRSFDWLLFEALQILTASHCGATLARPHETPKLQKILA